MMSPLKWEAYPDASGWGTHLGNMLLSVYPLAYDPKGDPLTWGYTVRINGLLMAEDKTGFANKEDAMTLCHAEAIRLSYKSAEQNWFTLVVKGLESAGGGPLSACLPHLAGLVTQYILFGAEQYLELRVYSMKGEYVEIKIPVDWDQIRIRGSKEYLQDELRRLYPELAAAWLKIA